MENIIMLIFGSVHIYLIGIINIKAISAQFTLITGVKERRYTKVWKNSQHRNADYGISCIIKVLLFHFSMK